MTKSDARDLAGKYLENLQADSGLELSINDETTEEHQAGFVFFYNTVEYWRTRDVMTALAGNGPILVKHDAQILILPTSQSIEFSLRSI